MHAKLQGCQNGANYKKKISSNHKRKLRNIFQNMDYPSKNGRLWKTQLKVKDISKKNTYLFRNIAKGKLLKAFASFGYFLWVISHICTHQFHI